MSMIRITSREMHDFSEYIAEISGISLDQSKQYLLENRLQTILEDQGCSSFRELLRLAQKEKEGRLSNRIIDAISTNETYFFRDRVPFEILKHKIIPDILDRKRTLSLPEKKQLRIWCAACSTGQEVYSVIMSIMETVPDIHKYDIRVLGTDISGKAIARASSGRYTTHEAERGLTPDLRIKYFIEEDNFWRIRDEVRIMADFKRLNLLEPFYGIGPFDVIFCRNVSIYFSRPSKVRLFSKLARILDKNGFLIIGGSENLGDVAPQFTLQRHLKGIFYQRPDASGFSAEPTKHPVSDPDAAPKSSDLSKNIRSRSLKIDCSSVAPHTATHGTNIEKDRGTTGQQSKRSPQPTEKHVEPYIGKPIEKVEVRAALPLFVTPGDTATAETVPLLESILHRQRNMNSQPVFKRNQDENRQSLLKMIKEKHEKREKNKKREQSK